MVSHSIDPDIRTYNSLIQAWAYSNEIEKARKAFSIFRRITYADTQSYDRRSYMFLYNSVLQACALTNTTYSIEMSEAITISFDIFIKLEASRNMKPNELIYGTMLKVVGNLLISKDRNKMAISIFLKCKEAGMKNK